MKKNLRGVFTALITPFQSTGKIDWNAWEKLLLDQIQAGVAGVVPCGTTGESPTLTLDEKKALIESAVRLCSKTPLSVIAGTGLNSTFETVELSRWAESAGVDAVLLVTPYYNKPSQEGLTDHFQTVANSISCPIVLYNVPGRTGVSLTAPTIAQLSKNPIIRSIKEATGNVAFSSEILDACQSLNTTMDILSGDDSTFLPLLSIGAHGVISVASNLFPRQMVKLQELWSAGDIQGAQKLHRYFYPLFRDLFVESNPAPIKEAMAWIGIGEPHLRQPLQPLSDSNRALLMKSLQHCGFKQDGGTQ